MRGHLIVTTFNNIFKYIRLFNLNLQEDYGISRVCAHIFARSQFSSRTLLQHPQMHSCCSCYVIGRQAAAVRGGNLFHFKLLGLWEGGNAGQDLELYFSGVICWLHNRHLGLY